MRFIEIRRAFSYNYGWPQSDKYSVYFIIFRCLPERTRPAASSPFRCSTPILRSSASRLPPSAARRIPSPAPPTPESAASFSFGPELHQIYQLILLNKNIDVVEEANSQAFGKRVLALDYLALSEVSVRHHVDLEDLAINFKGLGRVDLCSFNVTSVLVVQ